MCHSNEIRDLGEKCRKLETKVQDEQERLKNMQQKFNDIQITNTFMIENTSKKEYVNIIMCLCVLHVGI